jgi:hypothetical protein
MFLSYRENATVNCGDNTPRPSSLLDEGESVRTKICGSQAQYDVQEEK